jgi:dTMP kinase
LKALKGAVVTSVRCEDSLDNSLFIVFEGIDGSGKSTQAAKLADRLAGLGIPVLLTSEPSDGPTGLVIRSLASRPSPEEEERLFTEDRRDHVSRVILPALAKGKTVICDRYVYSSAAYQGARGLDPATLINRNMLFAPRPDVIFLLEIPVDVALERIRSNRKGGFSAFEVRENLGLVDEIYGSLKDPAIQRIDGTLGPEEIHSVILNVLRSMGFRCDLAPRDDRPVS